MANYRKGDRFQLKQDPLVIWEVISSTQARLISGYEYPTSRPGSIIPISHPALNQSNTWVKIENKRQNFNTLYEKLSTD